MSDLAKLLAEIKLYEIQVKLMKNQNRIYACNDEVNALYSENSILSTQMRELESALAAHQETRTS